MIDLNGVKYYTLTEACNVLHVVRSTVFVWIKTGKLKAVKYSKYTLIAEEEIERFLSNLPDAKDWTKKR